MKKIMMSIMAVCSIFVLAACGNNETVAKTDAGDITSEDLYKAMKKDYGQQALQQAILAKVLNSKYKVSDKEVEAAIAPYKQQYGDQFETMLKQQGQTMSKFKEGVKLKLQLTKVTEAYVKPSEKELKKYYKTWQPKVDASHILVKDEAKAKEVKQKLASGKKFADLAKEYSTDTSNKDQGGKLAPFGPGMMDPAFEKAAYKLKKKGDISEPVKSSYGYHIIQLDADQKPKTTFAKDKKQVEKDYVEDKSTPDNQQKAIKKELKNANVKIEDKDLKSALDTLMGKGSSK